MEWIVHAVVISFCVLCPVHAAPVSPFVTQLTPHYAPAYHFPVIGQTRNSCYFTSVNIVLRAVSSAKIRLKKAMKQVGFDGSRLAYPKDQQAFEKLLHFSVVKSSKVTFLFTELTKWNPVLVSYLLQVGKHEYPHVSVAYSFDELGVWVSDPYTASRKRIKWEAIFDKHGNTKLNQLREPVFTPYANWKTDWKEREKHDDLWENEIHWK